jgi:hypothetical protein
MWKGKSTKPEARNPKQIRMKKIQNKEKKHEEIFSHRVHRAHREFLV